MSGEETTTGVGAFLPVVASHAHGPSEADLATIMGPPHGHHHGTLKVHALDYD